ncbi:unnamed protein product, partial [Mesorhabditis belari]|uniref:Uncharacterized protein n=1 Tax=Mesorhabditis belari TaxID=2138241 RepID=A0AAF3FEV3_9BILA
MLSRVIGSEIKSFTRLASTATRKKLILNRKKDKKAALTPHCQEKLKEWGSLLSKEIAAEEKQYLNLLDQGEEGLETLETRGRFLGGLINTSKEYSPFMGLQCVFRVPNRRNLDELKILKAGTPVTINTEDAKEKVAEAVIYGFESNLVGLKIRKQDNDKSQRIERGKRYSLLLSTTYGSYHSLMDHLKKRSIKKYEQYPGDLIMSTAFRDVPFPTIQNDREVRTFSDCDESQKRAVAAAMNRRRSFMCIQGPPGTGKTKVISEIIYQLTRKGNKVLVCAPSHSAVDNALDRVQDEQHAIRFHSEIETSMHNEMAKHPEFSKFEAITKSLGATHDSVNGKMMIQKANALRHGIIKEVIAKKNVIFCTVTSSMTAGVRRYGWEPDVVIIDEAAQCVEPASWVPILNARRVILVGDHQQLPPLVFSEEARNEKLHISLMERLANEFKNCNINFLLTKQYRMNEKIMRWSNENFYEGRLEAGEENRHINLSEISSLPETNIFAQPLLFFDTSSLNFSEKKNQFNQSFSNEGEAKVVLDYAQKLINVGVNAKDIGVITPYFGQVKVLSKMLSDQGLIVNTVDAFQGQEKEVILFSMVRDNRKKVLGFLNDYRRMNVAVTRAKRQFVLIGNKRMLDDDKILRSLRETIREQGRILNAEKVQRLNDLSTVIV